MYAFGLFTWMGGRLYVHLVYLIGWEEDDVCIWFIYLDGREMRWMAINIYKVKGTLSLFTMARVGREQDKVKGTISLSTRVSDGWDQAYSTHCIPLEYFLFKCMTTFSL